MVRGEAEERHEVDRRGGVGDGQPRHDAVEDGTRGGEQAAADEAEEEGEAEGPVGSGDVLVGRRRVGVGDGKGRGDGGGGRIGEARIYELSSDGAEDASLRREHLVAAAAGRERGHKGGRASRERERGAGSEQEESAATSPVLRVQPNWVRILPSTNSLQIHGSFLSIP